jgi:hypothetical protein
MYEPPLINFYEDAIQRNGDPRTLTATLNPTSLGAPAFPATLSDLPPGFTRPLQSIVTMDPDFSTQYTILSNVQLERALTNDFSGLRRLRQLAGPQHAGAGGHEPRPDRPDARRRPPDLLHRR